MNGITITCMLGRPRWPWLTVDRRLGIRLSLVVLVVHLLPYDAENLPPQIADIHEAEQRIAEVVEHATSMR